MGTQNPHRSIANGMGAQGRATQGELKPPASPHLQQGGSQELMSRMKLKNHNSIAGSAQPLPLSPEVHRGCLCSTWMCPEQDVAVSLYPLEVRLLGRALPVMSLIT